MALRAVCSRVPGRRPGLGPSQQHLRHPPSVVAPVQGSTPQPPAQSTRGHPTQDVGPRPAVMAPERVQVHTGSHIHQAEGHADDTINNARQQLEDLVHLQTVKPSVEGSTAVLPPADDGALTAFAQLSDMEQLNSEISGLLAEVQLEIESTLTQPDAVVQPASTLDVSASSSRMSMEVSTAHASTSAAPSRGLEGLLPAPVLAASRTRPGARRNKHWVASVKATIPADMSLTKSHRTSRRKPDAGPIANLLSSTDGGLLSQKEEVELHAAAKDFLQLQDLLAILRTTLKREPSLAELGAVLGVDETSLQLRMDCGSKARLALGQRNYRLVVAAARAFARSTPMQDLLLAGMDGLMQSLRKYDPSSGYRFSTYCMFWIRNSMIRAARPHLSGAHIPTHMLTLIKKVEKTYAMLKAANPPHSPDPSLQQLAAASGLSERRVQVALDNRLLTKPISLDAPIGDEGQSTLADLIEGSDDERVGHDAEQAAVHLDVTATVDGLLSSLDEAEEAIVRSRFGLATPEGAPGAQEVLGGIKLSKAKLRAIEAGLVKELRRRAQASGALQEIVVHAAGERELAPRTAAAYGKKTKG